MCISCNLILLIHVEIIFFIAIQICFFQSLRPALLNVREMCHRISEMGLCQIDKDRTYTLSEFREAQFNQLNDVSTSPTLSDFVLYTISLSDCVSYTRFLCHIVCHIQDFFVRLWVLRKSSLSDCGSYARFICQIVDLIQDFVRLWVLYKISLSECGSYTRFLCQSMGLIQDFFVRLLSYIQYCFVRMWVLYSISLSGYGSFICMEKSLFVRLWVFYQICCLSVVDLVSNLSVVCQVVGLLPNLLSVSCGSSVEFVVCLVLGLIQDCCLSDCRSSTKYFVCQVVGVIQDLLSVRLWVFYNLLLLSFRL